MSVGQETGGLIVICGIDGSGKTLQSKRLYARLQEHGLPAQYVEFPRYSDGFFGELIARYLRGEMAGGEGISPYLLSLPFACDRWEFSPTLREWTRRGEVVVCNRYVTANMAHQGGKISTKSEREAFYRWVEQLEYRVFGVPEPRMHIWLDIAPEHAVRLLGMKEERAYLQNKTDIHENIQHLQKAREAYAELACRMPDWITINCSGRNGPEPPERVEDAIWTQLQVILNIPEVER